MDPTPTMGRHRHLLEGRTGTFQETFSTPDRILLQGGQNMSVFPLAPNTDRTRGSSDMATGRKALIELAAHFKTDVPRLVQVRSKGASYTPSRKTVKWGLNSFRSIDALLHEFAHHLQKEPRFAALKPEGRILSPSWWSGVPRTARIIHGPDFFAALLEVATFAYAGDHSRYSWADEYKAIAKRYSREYGSSFSVRGPTVTRTWTNPVRVITPGSVHLVIGPAAYAAPRPKGTPSNARRAQGNAAWAPPSEANKFMGGCLWRKFKGNK